MYQSLRDIKGQVDLVIISVPAADTLAVIKECVPKKVKAVIIIPGGFSEVDKNSALESEIFAIANAAGFRVMGPNCLDPTALASFIRGVIKSKALTLFSLHRKSLPPNWKKTAM